MANSKRKCKQCKDYHPVKDGRVLPAGFFCSVDCQTDFAMWRLDVIRKKKIAKANKEANDNKKATRRKHRAQKATVKPISQLKNEAQAVFNKYVRLRDSFDGCISCDKPADWNGQWHASHFHTRGHSSSLRFNLHNVHKSCSVCNNFKSGNLAEYKPRLVDKIGSEKVEAMELVKSSPRQYSREYLERFKKIFSKRCRILEKRIELNR